MAFSADGSSLAVGGPGDDSLVTGMGESQFKQTALDNDDDFGAVYLYQNGAPRYGSGRKPYLRVGASRAAGHPRERSRD